MKKTGILRFLGTNCDRDVWSAVEASGGQPEWLWFENRFDPNQYAGFVLPGGFSYGDYLRCGALAARSPVMQSLREAVKRGFPVLGICNGFQILCEAELLPGALLKNRGLKFKDAWVDLKVEASTTHFSLIEDQSKFCRLPIAHADGRYYADEVVLQKIEEQELVFCRYLSNPNGSINDIAGVLNAQKNVAGLMPHPERAIADWMGGKDGLKVFEDLCGGR